MFNSITEKFRKAGWLILVVAILSIAVFASHKSYAQGVPGRGQALEISPPVMSLRSDPGKTVKAIVRIRNVAKTDLIVTGQANDFVAAGEDGTPKILINETTPGPYSIKDWITIPTTLRLVPQEIKTMSIIINVPANASPGGHYGVVRFTGIPPELQGQGVALNASLGSLILFSVNGAITENLSVSDFTANKDGKSGSFFDSMPISLAARIKNSGNTHERPSGAVTVTNMFGKNVVTYAYNPQARYILPGSTRKFEQLLDKKTVGNKRFFGKYTAKITVFYGQGNNKTTTASVSFWIIPWKLILGIIVALIGGFMLIRYIIRRYNRYIIGRSQGPRRY